jgi:ubiquinone/menaquinone biosynthesis C-methylase UbiE
LTPYFEQVIATDASEKQIANAIEHSKITYLVAPAEKTSIESASLDLIVVAQALHWFDFGRFYAEVRRVSKPGGVLAAWSYSLLRIAPEIDLVLDKFYTDVVGSFWPRERKLVNDRYQSIIFPFGELDAPQFKMEAEWSLEHLIGYLGTWSAVQRYKEKHKSDPVEAFAEDLKLLWGQPQDERRVHWPINMRVGRVQQAAGSRQ